MIPRILHWISSGIGHSPQTRKISGRDYGVWIRAYFLPPTPLILNPVLLLAFSFGTFAFAKDQASSLLDGLLKEYPKPLPISIGMVLWS